MQKHILHAENVPTTHIFNHPTIHVNSPHPYLLGFDSNLFPNFNILLFSCILERIPNIWKNQRDSLVLKRLLLGITRMLGKFIRLVLFSYRIQQGPLQIPNTWTIHWIRSEYTEYSGKSSKGAVKWQKLPHQHKKFPKIRNNHLKFAH